MSVSINKLRRFGDFGWAWEEMDEYAEIYTRYRTNSGGEGLFEDDPDRLPCNDRQLLGTGQFSLRGCDYRRAYSRIRAALLRESRQR